MLRLPGQRRHRYARLVTGRTERDLALGGDAFGTVVHFQRREFALVDGDRAVVQAFAAIIGGERVGQREPHRGVYVEGRIVALFSLAPHVVDTNHAAEIELDRLVVPDALAEHVDFL